jgi:hypothetical protein
MIQGFPSVSNVQFGVWERGLANLNKKKQPSILDRLVWPVLLGAQVLPHPQLIFSFQNLVF